MRTIRQVGLVLLLLLGMLGTVSPMHVAAAGQMPATPSPGGDATLGADLGQRFVAAWNDGNVEAISRLMVVADEAMVLNPWIAVATPGQPDRVLAFGVGANPLELSAGDRLVLDPDALDAEPVTAAGVGLLVHLKTARMIDGVDAGPFELTLIVDCRQGRLIGSSVAPPGAVARDLTFAPGVDGCRLASPASPLESLLVAINSGDAAALRAVVMSDADATDQGVVLRFAFRFPDIPDEVGRSLFTGGLDPVPELGGWAERTRHIDLLAVRYQTASGATPAGGVVFGVIDGLYRDDTGQLHEITGKVGIECASGQVFDLHIGTPGTEGSVGA